MILTDYPGFNDNNFRDVRISAFEIYPKEARCKVFNKLIDNHYYNIYKPKTAKKGKANPMNFHPFSYQFYKCNPQLVFQCTVKDIDEPKKSEIDIECYIGPAEERTGSVLMPSNLLKAKEWAFMDFEKISKKCKITISEAEFARMSCQKKSEMVKWIDEEMREDLPLREIVSIEQHSTYRR